MRNPIYVGLAIIALAAAYTAGSNQFTLMSAVQAQVQNGPPLEQLRAQLADQPVKSPIPVLGKIYYVILTTATGDGTEARKYLNDHFLYQADLEKRGITFGAGPLTQVGGDERVGLIVIRANSPEEARKIADSDPEHIHKARTYKLYRWMLNEGQISLKVNLSEQKIILE
ncbi:MAG: YciI family protein [Pseudomonadota bacterium]